MYMLKKPKNLEVKRFWALRKATSGCCLTLQLYRGTSDTGQENGLPYHVVADLVGGCTNKNHQLHTDSVYASLLLILGLQAKSPLCSLVRPYRRQFSQQFNASKVL